MFELYCMEGLCLWHKHMPSIVSINYANSIMMEGLRLWEMGLVSNGAYNINQNYIRVCFNVHSSGGKDGELNEPWEAWEECLKHSVGFGYCSFGFRYGGGGGLALLMRAAQPAEFHALP